MYGILSLEVQGIAEAILLMSEMQASLEKYPHLYSHGGIGTNEGDNGCSQNVVISPHPALSM